MGQGEPEKKGLRRSSVVALGALAVWLASLPFQAYVSYGSPPQTLTGLFLLGFGWLGVLGVGVAWFANPLFLIALARSRAGGTGFAALAALLALDSLRIDSWPTGSGGSHHIYGYGAGFALWLAAIGLALVATGMREQEKPDYPADSTGAEWARELGMVWLVAVVAGFGIFAIRDRAQAANAEQERLGSVLVKRGAVCDREPPVPSAVLSSPAIVEIPDSAGYPFNGPYSLLNWGIPVVRMKGYDYAQVGTGIDRMTRITRAQGEASASLTYAAESKGGGNASAIRVGLIAADRRMLLNHRWVPDGPHYSYCPDYKQSPTAGQQPRKVVMEALGLPDRAEPAAPDFWKTVTRVEGKVTGQESAAGAEWVNNNSGCPQGVGFSYERAQKERIEGTPFFLDKVAYSGMGPGMFSACLGHAVYIYSSSRNSGDYFLTITKRALDDLKRSWSVNVKVANASAALQERETRIVSIEEGGGTLRIRTRHYGHDQILTIEAPLP